jgi:hypothetical protein
MLERAWWGTDLGKYRDCSGTYERYPFESVPPAPKLDGTFSFLEGTKGKGAISFAQFMATPALQSQVPSCTACEWDLGQPVASRLREAKHTVRFYRDQQDCLFWYVLQGGEKDGAVVCSPIPFDDPTLDVDEPTVYAHTALVADSFEEFVWRVWMENVLWDKLHSSAPQLEPSQQRYVAHYQ